MCGTHTVNCLRIHNPNARDYIPLVGELRSHVSHGMAKKQENKTTTAITTAMMLLCDLGQFKLSELQLSHLPRDISVPFWS